MPDDPTSRPEWLRTDDGERLEAAWSGPDEPVAVAVLTHPHPRFGGDMGNIVPASLARLLPEHGIATIRFNFRGTGASTGVHGGGADEIADVRAAVDAATAAEPSRAVVAVGYSFGADVLLALADERLRGVVAVAPPLAVLPLDDLRAARGDAPTLVLAARHDQFREADDAAELVAGWPATTFEVLPGADHFMAGMTDEIAQRAASFLLPLVG